MKKFNFKNFLALSWPFFGLGFFLIWGYIYVKPMLPEDFGGFNRMREAIGDMFRGKEEPIDPDAKYRFFYSHDNLRPKTAEELWLLLGSGVSAKAPGEEAEVLNAATSLELETAVKKAKSGDFIYLQEGEYRVNLIIDKDLTIIGQGTSTVIKGGETGTAIFVENSEFNISHCLITDSNSALKIRNSRGEIRAMVIKDNLKSGLELRNSNFAIKKNIITGNGSYGVFADAESELVVEGNYIRENIGFQVRVEGRGEIYR